MVDPIGVAGLAVGTASILFQIYAGVVQGIQLMLDVKDVPQDYGILYCRLKLEHDKLLSWGRSFGFVEDSVEDKPPLQISVPDQVRYTIQGYLEPLWNHILEFTTEITPSEGPSSYGSGHRFILSRKCGELKLMGHKLKDRIKWAHFKMKKLEGLVDCATHVNNSVIALSELKTQQEIHEMVQSTWMGLLDVRKTVGGLRELIEALKPDRAPGLSQTEDLLRSLAQLKKLRVQSDDNTPISTGELDNKSFLKLEADRVCPQEPEYASLGQRFEAKVDDEPGYWVEYKTYPQSAEPPGPTKEDIEQLVVCELAMLLRLKLPPSFRVPHCIGYYDEGGAFGLLFQKPPSEESSHIIPLSHCLKHKSLQPDLGARLALARAVVETVYQLHVVDWLHKALRAENILLFERMDNFIAYTEPYVSGFELARPASRLNMTQEADSGCKDDEFYRHPNNQLCNPHHGNYRYRKDFDLYSLGILLVEIALWSPIKTVVGDVEASEVKSFILSESVGIMSSIRFAVGGAFAEAVLVCLRGLDNKAESESYTVSFERLVVKKVRGITVNG